MFRTRALHAVGDTLLAIMTGHAAIVDLEAGTITSLGALSGEDRVTIASNNASTPNIVAVTDLGVFNVYVGAPPDVWADGDLPADPACVAFQAGYFFFGYPDGRIFASGINNVSVAADHFTTFQTRPGGVKRLVPFRGDLLAFGPFAVGVYRNTANPVAFPYSLGDTVGKGLAGKFAVAGWQDGFTDEVLWVGDDNVVYRLNGYSPEPVSTPDVVRSIEGVADKEDLDAIVYMHGPHAIWAISGPGFTWELNLSTNRWNERRSYGSSRWFAQSSIRFGGQWIVGSATSGKLYGVSPEVQAEDGQPLIAEVWSMPASAFPARVAVPKADFDMIVGVGLASGEDPIETKPRVSISWSDDGGMTWSTPLLRALGGEGEYQTRISLLRTGLSGAKGRQWKLVMSDPRYMGLVAGAQAAVPRD